MRKLTGLLSAFVVLMTVCDGAVAGGAYIGGGRGFMAALPGLAIEQPKSHLDVPFVPTPDEVVEAMLKVAGLNKNDLLYDLGCGDGRIVVNAAKRFGVRGIGVDLDPQRIKESEENARKERVADRVQFLNRDLFSMDIGKATVMTLYLLPSVNRKLRPRILSELKPGARIVSHDFDMGEWAPDKELEVSGHKVYYWVVPANASGAWEWAMPGMRGRHKYSLRLRQQFQKVGGVLKADDSEAELRDVKLEGDTLQFTVTQKIAGLKTPARFRGRIKGNNIEGSIKPVSGRTSAEWKASRSKATVIPLDREEEEREPRAFKMIKNIHLRGFHIGWLPFSDGRE